ncbi:hypothetical protein DNTS_029087 [Danionella cerebrum]|uniref:C2H2-type domain-containing protein n=1 Tax=Danionella cerebrum TaxID=2873325 RepID=A0A553QR80_9TELE|nr:hypothetical protein DNTS_029087 [Danionella translucida]
MMQSGLDMKPFMTFPVESTSPVGLFPNFNTMDPVQKAVINHTFGVSIPPKKKQVISCNICQLRFNSDKNLEPLAAQKVPGSPQAFVPLATSTASSCETAPARGSPPTEPTGHPTVLKNTSKPAAVPSTPTEPSVESEEEKAKKLLYCSLCKVAVNSLSQLEAHNTGPIKAYPRPGSKLKVQATQINKGSGLQNKTFHCEICDVHVNSEIQLKQHISSRRHKDRVAGKPTKPKYSPYNKQQRSSSSLAAKLAIQSDLVKPISPAFLSSPFSPSTVPSIALHPRHSSTIFQTASLAPSFLRAAPGPIRPSPGSILFAPY